MYLHMLKESDLPNGKVALTGKCVFGGGVYTVEVDPTELMRFRNGALAQDAFPSLSVDDREFLISGISPTGWEQKVGSDD